MKLYFLLFPSRVNQWALWAFLRVRNYHHQPCLRSCLSLSEILSSFRDVVASLLDLWKSLIHTDFSLYTLFLFDVILPTGCNMTSVVALVQECLVLSNLAWICIALMCWSTGELHHAPDDRWMVQDLVHPKRICIDNEPVWLRGIVVQEELYRVYDWEHTTAILQ